MLCAIILAAIGGMDASGLKWAALSGAIHLPYCWFLAHAYDHSDFSLAYPIARGGGALLAGIGGLLLLGDKLSLTRMAAVGVVACGLFALAGRTAGAELRAPFVVALAIGAYSIIDAKGIRATTGGAYIFASFIATMLTTTAFGLATRRGAAMIGALRTEWRRFSVIGVAATITYGMVQLAFRRAPVGYVTALRESGVVLAAFAGTRVLGESSGERRILSSLVVLAGLLLLILAR